MTIKKYLENTELSTEVKYWINHNLKNYLLKNSENQGEVEHILDFLCSDAAPNRLQKMSYVEARQGAEKWVAAMNKKAGGIIETESDTQVVLDFENGVKLVKLVNKCAFQREGLLMSNCVASYHGKTNSIVYSLRDSKNFPHVTIEVLTDGDQIHQIKGKGNGSIHPKYIKYVMKSLDKIGKKVRLEEMTYLGYDLLPDDAWWKYLESSFNGIQYINYQGKKLMYKNSKLVPKN